MAEKLFAKDRVCAVLDVFDFPEGDKPDVDMKGDTYAETEFQLNDELDWVFVEAMGDDVVEIALRTTLDRAKLVAAFLNTLNGEG